MRLIKPLLMLLVLLFGQAHGVVSHTDFLLHLHTAGQTHPVSDNRHPAEDAEKGPHCHIAVKHGDQAQPGMVAKAPHVELLAILPTAFLVAISSEIADTRPRSVFVGVHFANAPPLARPSRAPPVLSD